MRLGPRSLLGQVMMALAAALLIAQAISAGMLYRAANERRELAFMNAAAFQLLSGTRNDDRRGRRDRPPPRHRPREEESGLRLPRSFRYTETLAFPLPDDAPRDERREAVLETLLEEQGMAVESIAITIRPLAREPGIGEAIRNDGTLRRARQGLPRDLMVVALKQQDTDVWQVARLPVPPPDRAVLRTLVLQTVILFAVLVGLLYLVLRRITHPLDALAVRTRRFAGSGSAEPPLPASGPDDVRKLIEAHNAMHARIVSMLDEKDVMLGAIGHDLKTPLAALRVRIESVEDDAARARMAASIEDITQTLDEILALARVGRNDTPAEMTELGALAASVVEEFEDMGRPVTLAMQGRVAAPVHLTWLKRGLRNLITNALRYAGTARVEVLRADGMAILRVDDDGPGIPEHRIHEMLEPFTRGEASRNRATGGSGLGLTLARAVAEQHGGMLVLANRPEGGLRAEFRIPL
ncbi:sensor histidine kinase [Qipengyuania mesophila]|uniref:sensor histidine kinase n=1 Tax=Qipengyuania mesophila TaxID=2867246 RepID=UPI0035177EE7